jgi:glutamyl/glutaminyl-tRNA synthetase
MVDMSLLEACIRDELNRTAPRKMAVIDPLKVVIDNYPEGQVEYFEAVNNPEDPSAGKRKVPFSKVLYIERGDFQEVPPPKFFRLSPGREVRLRYAYFLKCESVVKDAQGEIVELHCTLPHAAATPLTGARSKPPSIGYPPPMPCRPRCACMTGCSTTPIPRSAATSSRTSTPTR